MSEIASPRRKTLDLLNDFLNKPDEDSNIGVDVIMTYKKALEEELCKIMDRFINMINECMKEDDDLELKALFHCV